MKIKRLSDWQDDFREWPINNYFTENRSLMLDSNLPNDRKTKYVRTGKLKINQSLERGKQHVTC